MRQMLWLLIVAGALAAAAPQATAQGFATYHCRDGSEFVAAFYEGDKRAHLQLDGKAVALSKRVALSGTRYVRRDITLRFSKTGVTLTRGKQTTICALR